jgi:hypothetical protein
LENLRGARLGRVEMMMRCSENALLLMSLAEFEKTLILIVFLSLLPRYI